MFEKKKDVFTVCVRVQRTYSQNKITPGYIYRENLPLSSNDRLVC